MRIGWLACGALLLLVGTAAAAGPAAEKPQVYVECRYIRFRMAPDAASQDGGIARFLNRYRVAVEGLPTFFDYDARSAILRAVKDANTASVMQAPSLLMADGKESEVTLGMDVTYTSGFRLDDAGEVVPVTSKTKNDVRCTFQPSQLDDGRTVELRYEWRFRTVDKLVPREIAFRTADNALHTFTVHCPVTSSIGGSGTLHVPEKASALPLYMHRRGERIPARLFGAAREGERVGSMLMLTVSSMPEHTAPPGDEPPAELSVGTPQHVARFRMLAPRADAEDKPTEALWDVTLLGIDGRPATYVQQSDIHYPATIDLRHPKGPLVTSDSVTLGLRLGVVPHRLDDGRMELALDVAYAWNPNEHAPGPKGKGGAPGNDISLGIATPSVRCLRYKGMLMLKPDSEMRVPLEGSTTPKAEKDAGLVLLVSARTLAPAKGAD